MPIKDIMKNISAIFSGFCSFCRIHSWSKRRKIWTKWLKSSLQQRWTHLF